MKINKEKSRINRIKILIKLVKTKCLDGLFLWNNNHNYLWNNGATTKTIIVTTAGAYFVKVTNAAGCDSRDTININITAMPVVSLGQDISVFVGSAITLNAGNTVSTYLWSTGATTQTIAPPVSGTYIVTVTSGTCSAMDTINVTFNALPVVNLGLDLNICTSDTITLDAGNPGSTYLWSTGATTRTIAVNLAATYSVEVTNANGCKTTDQVIVTNKAIPNANFTAQAVNSLNYQFTATAQVGSTFEWNFGDPTSAANTSALVDPIHEYTAAGTYFVTLRVTNVATGCVSINVDTLNLVVIPNPFVGQTKVEYTLWKDAENVTMEVFDVVGRKVARLVNGESQLAGKHSLLYVNEDKLIGSGVYIVQLTVDGKTSIIRMIDIANKL